MPPPPPPPSDSPDPGGYYAVVPESGEPPTGASPPSARPFPEAAAVIAGVVADVPLGPVGRFLVAAGPDGAAVLVDSVTGRSWRLPPGALAWEPLAYAGTAPDAPP